MDPKKRTQPPSATGGAAEGTKRPRQLDDDIEDMDVMDAEMFGSNEQEEFIPEDDDLVLQPSTNQQRGQYRARFRYSRPPLPEGGINPSTHNLGVCGCLLWFCTPHPCCSSACLNVFYCMHHFLGDIVLSNGTMLSSPLPFFTPLSFRVHTPHTHSLSTAGGGHLAISPSPCA